jgi:hydrogenase maturation protease
VAEVDRRRAVIVGLGNPILSDDAVGLAVARLVYQPLAAGREVSGWDVDLIEAAVGGFELVEMVAGYDKAVIVDAIQTEGGRVGDCYRVDLDGPTRTEQPAMRHQVGLVEGLELARRLAVDVPQCVRVYAVEVADIHTFATEMTDRVKAAVPGIAGDILSAEFGVGNTRLERGILSGERPW